MPKVAVTGGLCVNTGSASVNSQMKEGGAIATVFVKGDECWVVCGSGIGVAMPGIAVAGGDCGDGAVAVIYC